MSDDAPAPAGALTSLTLFMQLERSARQAPDLDALRFVMVNETRRLIEYHRAAFLAVAPAGRLRVEAVSGVAVVETSAPLVQWLEAVAARNHHAQTPTNLSRDALPDALQEGWKSFVGGHVYWVPLRHPDGLVVGYLWLERPRPWEEGERVIIERLAEAYAHAWRALSPMPKRYRTFLHRPRLLAILAAALTVVMIMPVSQTALAPAQVVPREPLVVAAPLEGVIKEVLVEPNQTVKKGEPLVQFEDLVLRSRYEVAEKTLAVAQAEARATEQSAFNDHQSNARLPLLRTQVELRAAERDYARELLGRVILYAERDGVAVFRDPNDWRGRPVKVGEQIMRLADPAKAELQVYLPVADAITLQPGAKIRLFLDTDPLHPHQARVERASYDAEITDAGLLAYRLNGAFTGATPPRIGLQGTAKVYGEPVMLSFYLLRRPIAAARQFFGW